MQSTPVIGSSTRSESDLADSYNSHKSTASPVWEWGIVSIKPQNVDHETPMNPITIMRNALGVAEGGRYDTPLAPRHDTRTHSSRARE